ncbi:molybdopterin-guanine dinucleotide biosynthesis protein A [Povalibacter uvarum]|uniref:Molybdenum cofactor guanylyltransferase n=1 Tax=Povalibacter uvarum TaxID=732238 RepID=A0A841HN32_9GAMM|nr:MoaD family protein [Povalibacter uvarum]MBB6093578.1 molybdopterin-guanine dinucleotide biosynthesis protein A [Povalibacter uvarum]
MSALFGLILAGGASTRMKRDKAALTYHGKSQLQWTYELVSDVCAATFVSVRPDQRDETTRAAFPQVVDRQPGIGPIAGISAALAQHPKAAWLIVACDLPFLTRETLEQLIAHRDPNRIATAYRSAHDSLPEPLCAIWEPAAREPLQAYVDAGKQCPRKFLINANTLLLDLPQASALDNINTTDEFDAASKTLHGASPERTAPAGESRSLRVQYFALFREQAGRSEETLDTPAATPGDLYRELQSRYPFKLTREQLKVAINDEFSGWDARLKNGDTIVFIPPVAGG